MCVGKFGSGQGPDRPVGMGEVLVTVQCEERKWHGATEAIHPSAVTQRAQKMSPRHFEDRTVAYMCRGVKVSSSHPLFGCPLVPMLHTCFSNV